MAYVSQIKLPNEAEARLVKDTEARNIANSKAADAVFIPADPSAATPVEAKRGLVPAPPSTPGSTKFLREDATWAVPAGVTDYEQLDNKPQINSVTLTGNQSAADLHLQKSITIDVDGTATAIADSSNATEFLAGSNVTITGDTTNGTITIAATDTTYESKQAASGGTDVSLVTTGEKYLWSDKQTGIIMDIPDSNDPPQLVPTRIIDGNKNTKFIEGTNVTLTPDTTNGTITFSATDTTYTDFVGSGATAAAGLVPAPDTTAGTSKFLCEDGSWAEPPGTTYSEGTGIDIDNDTISNTGVLNVTTDNTDTDAANGTVTISKLDANGDVEEVEVAVKGLAAAAYKGVDSTITEQSTADNVPTSDVVYGYVQSAISGITGPMTFKGAASITADSTDTTLCSITVTTPESSSNIKKGFTYKITTIASSPAYTGPLKIGDTLIADKANPKVTADWVENTDWTVIPSGDDETFPKFTYVVETEEGQPVKYIAIDYGS